MKPHKLSCRQIDMTLDTLAPRRVRAPSSPPPAWSWRERCACSWGRELGRSRARPRAALATRTRLTDPHDPTHSASILGSVSGHGQALSGSVLSSRLEMLERTKVHTWLGSGLGLGVRVRGAREDKRSTPTSCMEKHGQTAVKSTALEAASSSTRGSGCGRSVGRPPPGSARPPRAARRALRRHRSRAGALPRRGGGTLSTRPREGHACDEGDAPLRGDHAEGEALHLVRVKG